MAVECTCLTNNNTDPALEHMDHCKLSKGGDVLVFRNEVGQPVAVPETVVLENDRTYRAYQAHMAGQSWAQIAATEGYASWRAVQYDVQRWIDEGRSLISDRTRRDMLQTEVARLDALQNAVWPAAMKGHLPAVNTAIQLIATRVKMLHLDEMQGEEEIAGPKTVIVPMGDDYLEVLEAVANEGSGPE